MNCLRCGTEMTDLGCEEIQLGHYGFFSGHLSNLFSGSMEVRIYSSRTAGRWNSSTLTLSMKRAFQRE